MITEERAKRLFKEANPAPMSLEIEIDEPSVAAYLATLDERSSNVTETQTKNRPGREDASRTRPWIAAAAAVLVVALGAVLVNRANDTASGPPEVSAVLAAIESYNAGDIDGWISAFDPAAQSGWEHNGETRYFDEIFMNANRELMITEPCTLVEPNLVECGLSGYDDFHGPAGLVETGPSTFQLNDQLLITDWEWESNCCAQQITYTTSFNNWLSIVHPEVYASVDPPDLDSLPGWQSDPSDMAVAIEYVDEFVAQSRFYPLESSGS